MLLCEQMKDYEKTSCSVDIKQYFSLFPPRTASSNAAPYRTAHANRSAAATWPIPLDEHLLFCSALPLPVSSNMWGQSWLWLFSEELRSQTAFAVSATAPSRAGRAGTSATDPGTGVGGKQKSRGGRKLSCSCFASVPSSQGSLILSPSSTDFFSGKWASSTLAAKPAVASWVREFPQPPFIPVPGTICIRDRQSLEERSKENCSPKERHRALGTPSIQPLATATRQSCLPVVRATAAAPCLASSLAPWRSRKTTLCFPLETTPASAALRLTEQGPQHAGQKHPGVGQRW